MKVRWTEDSLRLRVTPTELDALCSGGAIEASLAFPSAPDLDAPVRWHIVLRLDENLRVAEMRSGSANTALVLITAADIAKLREPTREGVYFATPTGDGRETRFYVEKDFPCIHPRAGEANETPTETFAPPTDFAQRKA